VPSSLPNMSSWLVVPLLAVCVVKRQGPLVEGHGESSREEIPRTQGYQPQNRPTRRRHPGIAPDVQGEKPPAQVVVFLFPFLERGKRVRDMFDVHAPTHTSGVCVYCLPLLGFLPALAAEPPNLQSPTLAATSSWSFTCCAVSRSRALKPGNLQTASNAALPAFPRFRLPGTIFTCSHAHTHNDTVIVRA
jgi:hypothetical protein